MQPGLGIGDEQPHETFVLETFTNHDAVNVGFQEFVIWSLKWSMLISSEAETTIAALQKFTLSMVANTIITSEDVKHLLACTKNDVFPAQVANPYCNPASTTT